MLVVTHMSKNVIEKLSASRWPKDEPLYKFLKKEHADSLFNKGELKIGTLYDFRDQEKYGDARGDEGEGTKEEYDKIDYMEIENAKSNSLDTLANEFIKIKEGVTGTTLSNVEFRKKYNSPNYYIFRMSGEFDEKLYEKFQSDVCVKIKSPYKFIHSISIELRRHNADYVDLLKCIYTDREKEYDKRDDCHPALIKPVIHKVDKEVRSLWKSKTLDHNELEPLFIKFSVH